MFVRNHLIPANKVITVKQTDSVKTALEVMGTNGHDALPVVDEQNRLVGLISKQHVYKTCFLEDCNKQEFIANTAVHELMKTDFKHVQEDDLIEVAIQQMTAMRMQFIVAYNNRQQFAGILTRRSFLEALGNAMGLDKKGVRVEVVVGDIPGRLASLTRALAKSGYNIRSIFMLDQNVMDLQKILLRIDSRDDQRIVEILSDAGFKVLTSVLE